MARMARVVVPGYPHHVTQRANRRQKTFYTRTIILITSSATRLGCGYAGIRMTVNAPVLTHSYPHGGLMFRNILFSLMLLPSYSFACSCLQQSLSEHVADAQNIYVGVLTSSRIIEAKSDTEWPYLEGSISVETVIKGSPQKIENIRTGFGEGDCGIPMTIGRTYVIFLEKEQYHIGIPGTVYLTPRFDLLYRCEGRTVEQGGSIWPGWPA